MKPAAFLATLLLAASAASAQVGQAPGVSGPGTGANGACLLTGCTMTGPIIGSASQGYGGDTDNATLGAEMAANPSFTGSITGWSGAGWAYEAVNKARHTAGSTTALTQNVTVSIGTRYLVSITQTGRTAGSYGVSVGVATLQGGAYWDEDQVFEATESGSVALSVTPTTDFDGALTKVSIKPFASLVPMSFYIKPSLNPAGNYGANFRFSGGAASPFGFGFGFESLINGLAGGGSNAAFGDRALEQVTTGYWNHAYGYQALWHDTLGVENSAFGKWALQGNTTGSFNQAFGDEALLANRNGGQNVAVGFRALTSLVTGNSNTALGSTAGRGMTTGSTNLCVGASACWSPGGLSANALVTGSNNTNVGAQTGQGSTTQRTNSAAFGFNATYDCDNCQVFGNVSTTDAYFGSQAAPNATLHPARVLVPGGAASAPAYSWPARPTGGLNLESDFYTTLRGYRTSGTDQAGTSTIVGPGAGTGLAAGGTVYIEACPANATSGTTQNTCQNMALFQSGNILLGGIALDSGSPALNQLYGAIVRNGRTDVAAGAGGWNYRASQGTGLGAGGDHAFQVAPAAGSTGSTPNAFQTILAMSGTNGSVLLGNVTVQTPVASSFIGANAAAANTAGGANAIKGGNATNGNADGGAVTVAGGQPVGTGLQGVVDYGASWTKNAQGEAALTNSYTNATASFTATNLSILVTSGQTYRIQATIFVSDSTAADGAQLDFNGGSATATNFRMHCILDDTTTTILNSAQVTALATAFSIASLTGAAQWSCNGTFVPSSNGTFIIRGAQNTHSTGTLTFSRGSWLSVVNSRPL